MTDFVSLGGFVFRDFEIPEDLIFGGHQKTIEHHLIGGTRIVDAMGPVPAPVCWQGRFRGSDAMSRAATIDAMRQAGAQVPLIWGSLFRMVVVSTFIAKPQKAWEVPYQIECKVVDDPTMAGAGFGVAATSTLDALVSGDMASASISLGGVSLGF